MDPAEFIAKEDINQSVDGSKESEGVICEDKIVKTSNLSSARQQDNLQPKKQIGPLTFTPTPSLTDEELQVISTYANDNEAELMQWHYCLCHLPFNQFK